MTHVHKQEAAPGSGPGRRGKYVRAERHPLNTPIIEIKIGARLPNRRRSALDVALLMTDNEQDAYKVMSRTQRIAWWARRGFVVDPPEPTELERTPFECMPPRPPTEDDEQIEERR
jgi:hypothetical protein